MGKQGPCTHCGIGNTPLWRNGPPEKPVLCNACGSRWRTRGTLHGYLPLHAGGLGLGLQGGSKHKKPKPAAPPKAVRASKLGGNGPLKRKQGLEEDDDDDAAETFDDSDDEELFALEPSPIGAVVEEGGRMDVAGKSLPRGDYSGLEDWELTDEEEESDGGIVPRARNGAKGMGRSASTGMLPTASASRTFVVPSRKRSSTATTRLRVHSSSGLDTEVCEELMVHNMSPMVSMEMGLGSLMTRAPSCDTLESYGAAVGEFSYREERVTAMPRVPSVSSLRLGEHKQRAAPPWKGAKRNRELLESFPYSKRTVLGSPQSPLAFVDWKDIVNCENFYARLEAGQRYMLLQMLPPGDTAEGQSSVAAMFASSRFAEALGSFQKLLAGGMFDLDSQALPRQVRELFEALRDPNRLSLGGKGGWWEAWGQVADERKARSRQCGTKATGGKVASGGGSRGMSAPCPGMGSSVELPSGTATNVALVGEREGLLGHDFSSVWDELESGRCGGGGGVVVPGPASSHGGGYAESSLDVPSLFSTLTPNKSGGGEVSPTDDLLPGGGWIEGWDTPSSYPPRAYPGAV